MQCLIDTKNEQCLTTLLATASLSRLSLMFVYLNFLLLLSLVISNVESKARNISIDPLLLLKGPPTLLECMLLFIDATLLVALLDGLFLFLMMLMAPNSTTSSSSSISSISFPSSKSGTYSFKICYRLLLACFSSYALSSFTSFGDYHIEWCTCASL